MKTQFISLLIALLAGLLPLQAQQVSISGIVTDKKLNEPIIGASVVVKGTSNGCITDLDGNFQLNNVASGSTLVVSYIGYQTQEIPVQKGKTSYQVTLSEDTQTLDEVVVVGFGTQKKVNDRCRGHSRHQGFGIKTCVTSGTGIAGYRAGTKLINC